MSIALKELIEELRSELQMALASGEGEKVRFDLSEVTLEAEVEVRVDAGAKAGFKLIVFTKAEANVDAGSTRTHKVTLKLQPVMVVEGRTKPLQVGRSG